MYVVKISVPAERDMDRARRDWPVHRLRPVEVLEEDFKAALIKIAKNPLHFSLVDVPDFEGVRHVLMEAAEKVVFFKVRDARTVIVLRVRGGRQKTLKKM
jgi:hypothetical protein